MEKKAGSFRMISKNVLQVHSDEDRHRSDQIIKDEMYFSQSSVLFPKLCPSTIDWSSHSLGY